MDTTPHWKQVQRDFADIHTALQRVATAIFQVGEVAVPCSHESENGLDQALSHAFLTKSDGQIAFVNPDIRREYLARHAANILFQAWDDPKDFCDELNQIQRCTFQVDHSHKVAAIALLVLNQEYEKDITRRISEVAAQGIKGIKNSLFWDLFHPFCETLPNLKFEPESLADALENVIQAAAQDLAGGQLYYAVEHLAARSQVDADVLYNEFLVRAESPVVNLTINVLLGLAKSSLQEAHYRAITLVDSETLIYRRIGISALGRFQYSNNGEQRKLLNSTLDKLEAFRKIANPEIDDILAQAYGNLLEESEEAERAFVELALRNNLAVKNQIVHILCLKAREAFTQSWYRETISNLIQPSLPSLRMIEELDSCIKYYAENEPNTALGIIEALAINWDYSSAKEERDLPDILDTTFVELYNNHRDILLKGITRWLASSNQHLHLTAWKVQLHFSRVLTTTLNNETTEESIRRKIRNSAKITLSKQALDELDDQTVVYIIYRIAGYVVDAYSLASLLLSVLKREPSLPSVTGLVTSLLVNYVLYNYPGDGGDFLKYSLEFETTSDLEREIIQTALSHSDSYFEGRQSLPRLKEFKPSSQQVYLLRLAEWKHQASIIDEARKRSIFSFMTTNIPLKYGRAFSIEREGNFTEPSKLATFHHEQERPQGELIDPVGQTYQRLQWRNIGLEDLEPNSRDSHTGDPNS